MLMLVPGRFQIPVNLDIKLLVAGIGNCATAWNMKQWLSRNGKPDVADKCWNCRHF